MHNNILFRCDASDKIGSGHIIRCRTLARELKLDNNEVVFLCRKQKGDFIEILKKEFKTLELTEISLEKTAKATKNKYIYDSWLGCSQKEDAKKCLEIIHNKKYNFDWIILDHYGIDQDWQSEFLNGFSNTKKPKLMIIDDLSNRYHKANLILDQNIINSELENPYKNLVPKNCINLLGPKYALIGSEYSKLHPFIKKRTKFNRVFIYFGAIDPYNFIEKSIKILLEANIANLFIDIVIASNSESFKKIKEIAKEQKNINIYSSLPSLADLISKADFSIGAAGSTAWERVCLKLPSLVIATAENQLSFAKSLAKKGLIYLIGDHRTSEKELRNALNFLIKKNFSLFNFDYLVDGFGAKRVVNIINNIDKNYFLRSVEEEDELLLLNWANDSIVRKNSFSKSIINKKDHHIWFKKSLYNQERLHFIYQDKLFNPIGQIRFDINKDNLEILIDISLEESFRGKGLGTKLIKEGIDKISNELKGTYTLVAKIKKENFASMNIFSNAGFKALSEKKSETFFKMIKKVRFIYK